MSQSTPSTGLPVSPIAYGNPCGCKYYIGQHPPIEFCPLHAQAGQTKREHGELREALAELMNYADDPPCEASLTGECDKGYHNNHGLAIVKARAILKGLEG